MSVTFCMVRQVGERYQSVLHGDEDYSDESFNLCNRNAADLLAALGIEDDTMCDRWQINHFRALLTVARRKRLNYSSPEIKTTVDASPGHATFIDCGRDEGYIERRLQELSDLVNKGLDNGATHVSWG